MTTSFETDPILTNSGRAAGAELIRQLSTFKLEYSQSNESLHQRQPAAGKRQDNHIGPEQSRTRPKLLRQSTTNAEAGGRPTGKRQQLAQSGLNWRSCEAPPTDHGRRNIRAAVVVSSSPQPRPVEGASSTGSIALNHHLSDSAVAVNRRSPDFCSSPHRQHSPAAGQLPDSDESRCVRYQREGDQIILLPPASLVDTEVSTKKLVVVVGTRRDSPANVAAPSMGHAQGRTSLSSLSASRANRIRGIIILSSVVLVFTCVFLVGFTLRLAPLIDELGKKVVSSLIDCLPCRPSATADSWAVLLLSLVG